MNEYQYRKYKKNNTIFILLNENDQCKNHLDKVIDYLNEYILISFKSIYITHLFFRNNRLLEYFKGV